MLYWTIQTAVISFLLIFIIHHVIMFLKSMLTIPKIKDLVNIPTQKYENMYNIINNAHNPIVIKNNNNILPTEIENKTVEYTLIDDLLPRQNENVETINSNMKHELKLFLKTQLNEPKTSNDNNAFELVQPINSNSNSNSYSEYY